MSSPTSSPAPPPSIRDDRPDDADDDVDGGVVMNDTTLPIRRNNNKKTNPRRQGRPTTTKTTTTNRKKVGRFGLADWNRLLQNTNDLAQLHGKPVRNKIGWKEIRKHNNIHDGWICLRNKVYNITPYLHYHPGGLTILKPVLGKDATSLFEKYHRWVNEDGLIGKLLIGYLDTSSRLDDDDDSEEEEGSSSSYLPKQQQQQRIIAAAKPNNKKTEDGFAIPAPRKPSSSSRKRDQV